VVGIEVVIVDIITNLCIVVVGIEVVDVIVNLCVIVRSRER
jgi:hypothetical protein